MKRQSFTITKVALGVGLGLWALGTAARAVAQSSLSMAAGRIDKDLDASFKSQGIKVSSEARAVIRQQIVEKEVSKGTPPQEIKLAPEEAEVLGSQLASQSGSREVNAESARFILVKETLHSISASAAADVSGEAELTNVTLPTDTEHAIQQDILQFNTAMAESGLSADQITSVNKQFLREVYQQVGYGKTLELDQYPIIKLKIFPRVVKLNIVTEPAGATVQVSVGDANSPIGTTNITEKPFDPNKKYLFLFSLPGYQESKREYFMNPFPAIQTLQEALVKK